MQNQPATPPSAADYQALIGRLTAAVQSHAAAEIDAPTFRQRIAEIQAETRTLDLLRKLHRATQRLAAQEQNASQSPVSPC